MSPNVWHSSRIALVLLHINALTSNRHHHELSSIRELPLFSVIGQLIAMLDSKDSTLDWRMLAK